MGPITPNIIPLPSSSPPLPAVLLSPLAKKVIGVVAYIFFIIALMYYISSKLSSLKTNVDLEDFLEKNGRDLTKEAQSWNFFSVLKREAEVEQALGILSQVNHANLILIGEPGVGRDSVVHALAQKIAAGKAPPSLSGRKLISIEVSSLTANGTYYGMLETTIRNLVQDCKKAGHVILVVDQIEDIVSSGSSLRSIPSVATLLRKALSSNEIQFIGITTPHQFKKTIERDSALKGLYQTVSIKPLSLDATLEVAKLVSSSFGVLYRCRYDEAALKAAVDLSDHYLHDAHFPGKAIDILDTAGIKAKRRGLSAVTQREVEEVISERTNIPLAHIAKTESDYILKVAVSLKEAVIGQDEAIEAVCGALLRSSCDLKKEDEPIGVFLFAGSTGVGKTLLAEQLALQMFGTRDALIKVCLNEYTTLGSATRLIGAAPGYADHEEGGQLTEKVRKRPYSVVLFDEIEKAPSDICDMLLHMFEKGTIEDSSGRMIDFRHTIIIMTTNAGADISAGADLYSLVLYAQMVKNINEAVAKKFRPEFINRLEMVIFKTIQADNLDKLIDLELLSFQQNLKGKTFSVSEEAKKIIKTKGFQPKMGVRALARAIKNEVLTPLALAMTNNPSAKTFHVSARDGKITIETNHLAST